MSLDELTEVAELVLREYNIDGLDDIARLGEKLKLENFLKVVRHEAAIKQINKIPGRIDKPDISTLNSQALINRIKELYKDSAQIGNKSTADAIRYERIT